MKLDIITIDPSKICTGYYINTTDETGVIKNKTKTGNEDVLINIYYRMEDIVEQRNFDLAVIEGYSFNPVNPVAASVLMEIGGVIKLVFADHNIPVISIPPQSWRSKTIGKIKKSSKGKYIQAVKEKYGREFETTDEADAYMIYMALAEIAKKTKYLKPYEKVIREMIKYLIDKKTLHVKKMNYNHRWRNE